MFDNLKAEMARKNKTMVDFAKNPKLNLSYESVRNKCNGNTEWTRNEMFTIKSEYFPDKEIEYLFEQK